MPFAQCFHEIFTVLLLLLTLRSQRGCMMLQQHLKQMSGEEGFGTLGGGEQASAKRRGRKGAARKRGMSLDGRMPLFLRV